MKQLTIKPRNLHDLLNVVFVTEASKLSNVCYYPSITKYHSWLVKFIEPTPFHHGFRLLKNETTRCLLRAINEVNTVDNLVLVYRILSFHIYGNLMRKYIQYCNPKKMLVAIQKLSGNHFFKKYGIEKTLIRLGDTYAKKYGRNLSDDELVNMYLRLRTIINQMCKALARRYYALRPEDLEERSNVVGQLVSLLTDKLQYTNDRCLDEAVRFTKINTDILKEVIDKLSSNTMLLQSYLQLLLESVERRTQICSPIWRLSRLKRAQDTLHPLFKFVRQLDPTYRNTRQLSAAIAHYYLCAIKQLMC